MFHLMPHCCGPLFSNVRGPVILVPMRLLFMSISFVFLRVGIVLVSPGQIRWLLLNVLNLGTCLDQAIGDEFAVAIGNTFFSAHQAKRRRYAL